MLTRRRDASVKPARTVLARDTGTKVFAGRIPGPTYAAASTVWAPLADASCVRYSRAFPRENNEVHWARSECTEGSITRFGVAALSAREGNSTIADRVSLGAPEGVQ